MKVLLDTNIIIHRETNKIINQDIGNLFYWLDKLKLEKCIHPLTIIEINKHKNLNTAHSMNIKLNSYFELKTQAQLDSIIQQVSSQEDKTDNDFIDTKILNEVYAGRVDYLISEDKKIHKKAKLLSISEKVFTIDSFLEKTLTENPDLIEYKVLAVKKEYLGNINLQDNFFDSLREDYINFDKWFSKKSSEIAYTCYQDSNLSAFLFLKVENTEENYYNIQPILKQRKRLKIGTFKVIANGYKIGERFLKIIFDNAFVQKVEEIYVTIFDKRPEQKRLINLLEEWGFCYHGKKTTENGDENVYIKEFNRDNIKINLESPKQTYPYVSDKSDIYIVPIYQKYHTELFPDSILRTESPIDFVENEPYRNALSKIYISRSWERSLKSGDLIVFYRTGDKYNAIHTGVVTTIGVVEKVITDIKDENHFIKLCRKRSVFTDEELKEHWNYKSSKPFIVNFLYLYSFPKRPNLKWLNDNRIIPDIKDMPRGFRKISRENFNKIIRYAKQ